MKVCKGSKVEGALTYNRLAAGDVFRWKNTSGLDHDIMIRGPKQCTWIGKYDAGIVYYPIGGNQEVIRYPNACIVLGDPE